MAGLRGPLFSLGASGRLSRALTLARRLTGPRWLLRGRPADPRTQAQLTWRNMYRLAASLWHQLSAEEQAEWEADGTARGMTGYAWWMSQALRPNPGIYLPLAGGKMSGDIDMHGNMVEDLPAPAAAGDAARKAYVDAHAGAPSLFSWRRLNQWHFSSPAASSGTIVLPNDYLQAVPFYTPEALTVDRIGIRVAVGNAGDARLGIYEDDGNVYPGALLLDCGTVDVTAAGNKEIIGLAQAFAAATLHWLVYLSDASPELRMQTRGVSWALIGSDSSDNWSLQGTWTKSQAYGAMPDPFPAAATRSVNTKPAIGVYPT